MRDELYEDVKAYMARFQNCSAKDILRLLGEMRAFWYKCMTPEDLAKYEKIRTEVLDRRLDEK